MSPRIFRLRLCCGHGIVVGCQMEAFNSKTYYIIYLLLSLPGGSEYNKSCQIWVKGFYTDMFPIQTKSQVSKVNLTETKSLSVEQQSPFWCIQASRRVEAWFSQYKHLCFSVILFLNL